MITLLTAALSLSGQAALVLKGFDPIDLVEGKEVAGQTELSTTLGRHEYRFCSKEHMEAFKAEPFKHGIQNGGACGKMGAMTGQGSPDRWAVVNGKIFLFASDGCRDTFLIRKEAYFAPLPTVPPATEADRKQAKALFDKMIEAHGGAKAIAGVKSIEWAYEIPYNDGGAKKIWLTKAAYLGPDRFAMWEQWDAGRSFFVKDGDRASEGKPGATYSVHPGEMREFVASVARTPVAILLGGATPVTPLSGEPGLVMVRDDIVFSVHLDQATSRIVQIKFRDKYSGPVDSVVVEFSDYVVTDGLALPKTSRAKVGDKDWGKPKTIATYVVNGEVSPVFVEAFQK